MTDGIRFNIETVEPKQPGGFHAFTSTAAIGQQIMVRERIELCVQPRPWFCPSWLWNRLVVRVIVKTVEL